MNQGFIERAYNQDGLPTMGTITLAGLTRRTLELPWGHNAKNVSCSPEGTYTMFRHNSADHPNTWLFVNPTLHIYATPEEAAKDPLGRSELLLHNGNFKKNSLGCTLVGRQQVVMDGELAVTDSVAVLAELMTNTSSWQDGWKMIVRNYSPGYQP